MVKIMSRTVFWSLLLVGGSAQLSMASDTNVNMVAAFVKDMVTVINNEGLDGLCKKDGFFLRHEDKCAEYFPKDIIIAACAVDSGFQSSKCGKSINSKESWLKVSEDARKEITQQMQNKNPTFVALVCNSNREKLKGKMPIFRGVADRFCDALGSSSSSSSSTSGQQPMEETIIIKEFERVPPLSTLAKIQIDAGRITLTDPSQRDKLVKSVDELRKFYNVIEMRGIIKKVKDGQTLTEGELHMLTDFKKSLDDLKKYARNLGIQLAQ